MFCWHHVREIRWSLADSPRKWPVRLSFGVFFAVSTNRFRTKKNHVARDSHLTSPRYSEFGITFGRYINCNASVPLIFERYDALVRLVTNAITAFKRNCVHLCHVVLVKHSTRNVIQWKWYTFMHFLKRWHIIKLVSPYIYSNAYKYTAIWYVSIDITWPLRA